MKWILTALMVGLLTATTSCTDAKSPNSNKQESVFAAQDGTPQEQFTADFKNSTSASFRATYTATLKIDDGELRTATTWYRDGVSRQRFDFEGAYEFLRVQKATVFTVGYKDRIVVCSDEFPSLDQTQSGACCEDDSGCGDAAANMLYFLGFPLGYSPDDTETDGPADALEGVTITRLPQRTIAGLEARCYALEPTDPGTDYPDASFETCYAASGVPLYWHATNGPSGDQEVQATSVDSPEDRDFDFPYLIHVPTEEPYVETTPVPPVRVAVRLRFAGGADAVSIDAALALIRRRIATGPGCYSIPFKELDECITTEKNGDDYILSFGVSEHRDPMTDAEISEWLTVRADKRVRLRFCEALQNESGLVATIPSEQHRGIVYQPGTCQPVRNADGEVQVRQGGSASSWILPTYTDVAKAELDDIVWTPAIGELNAKPQAMTDEYLEPDAYADHPYIEPPDPSVGWRAVYRTTDDGETILASITARLAPEGTSVAEQRRAAEGGYPLSFFLDGEPVRNWEREVAAARISRADFPPTLIFGLTRDVARSVALALNGPALALPVQVVGVTRS